MSKIVLISNNKILYDGEVTILKDLYLFGGYIYDKTIKRLTSRDGDKETIVDISKRRITINQRNELIELSITVNYFVEKDNTIEFDYKLERENFNIKIEVGD